MLHKNTRSYAISGGHPSTVWAAEEIFRQGGNAFDAGIAAYAASWIAEPCMSGAGGGGFAMARESGGDKRLFDFFCRTPLIRTDNPKPDFFPVTVDFGDEQEDFYVGMASIAAPGAVAGIWCLIEQYATLPARVLLEPAVKLAREGVKINAFQLYDFQLLESIIRLDKRGREIFLKDDMLKGEGEYLFFPDKGAFLEALGREGPDPFYRGELAREVSNTSAERGGHIGFDDFQHYKVFQCKPLAFPYSKSRIYTNAFPSTGGALMAVYLDEQQKRLQESKSPEGSLVEAAVYCQKMAKSREHLTEELLRRFGDSAVNEEQSGPMGRAGTTHMNCVDSEGNGISISSSLGEGSGYFIPGTDIQLNNMLGEAALFPDGLNSWDVGIRLSSMMSPTCIENKAEREFTMLGSGGAGRIPYVIGQVIAHMSGGGLSLREAIEQPRMHLHGGKLNIEPGYRIPDFPEGHHFALRKWKKQSLYFGGVHGVRYANGTLTAHADHRREGVSAVC